MDKIIMLALFFAVMAGIGIYCRSKIKNIGDFVLAGRNIGPWLAAFSYGTAYFSAVIFIGYAGKFGWNYGPAAVWIGIGNALIGSLLAWVVLGKRTRRITQNLNARTIPEFFEKRFDSRGIKLFASIIIFVFLIPYSASVYTGLGRLFKMAFGIEYIYCMIGMAVITGIYLVLGGYLATAINDFIQGIIMLVGITLVIGFVINYNEVGGLANGINQLKQLGEQAAANGGVNNFTILGGDPINLIGLVLLTSLGSWGLPQMLHKFYSIKNTKSIKTGAIISTVFALIIAGGSYFIGVFGKLVVKQPELLPNGKIDFDAIMPMMLEATLPSIMIGVVVILVLSASMSTLSSLVLVSSSTITLDFIKNLFIPKMSKDRQVFITRIFCGIFIAASVAIALVKGPIVTLMSYSWGAVAGSFLAPYLYGLFWKGVTKKGVYSGFITAITVTVTAIIINFAKIALPETLAKYNTPPNWGVIAILLPLIVVPIVSIFTKKLSPETLDEVFDRALEINNI